MFAVSPTSQYFFLIQSLLLPPINHHRCKINCNLSVMYILQLLHQICKKVATTRCRLRKNLDQTRFRVECWWILGKNLLEFYKYIMKIQINPVGAGAWAEDDNEKTILQKICLLLVFLTIGSFACSFCFPHKIAYLQCSPINHQKCNINSNLSVIYLARNGLVYSWLVIKC